MAPKGCMLRYVLLPIRRNFILKNYQKGWFHYMLILDIVLDIWTLHHPNENTTPLRRPFYILNHYTFKYQ